MSRQQLFAAFFFAVFLFLLYQLYLFLAPFFAPLLWAGVLALIFYPLTTWLVRVFRGSRTVAALVLVIGVLVIAILPSIYLGSLLVRQTAGAYARVQEMVRTGEMQRLVEDLRASRPGQLWERATNLLGERPPIDPADVVLRASNWVSERIVGQATGLARNVLVTLLHFVLMVVALFFFFRDGERIAGLVRELLPMEPEHKAAVFARLSGTLTAVVQGMVVTAVAQGLLAGLGYWLIGGVSFSVFLGFLTGLASFLPLAGPALVWGSVAIGLFLSDHAYRAIGIALWGFAVVSTADNLIKPLFIGGRAKLPTFLLLLALLGGLSVYGFLGVFLGPVVVAILLAFIDIYREEYHDAAAPTGGDATLEELKP